MVEVLPMSRSPLLGVCLLMRNVDRSFLIEDLMPLLDSRVIRVCIHTCHSHITGFVSALQVLVGHCQSDACPAWIGFIHPHIAGLCVVKKMARIFNISLTGCSCLFEFISDGNRCARLRQGSAQMIRRFH